MSSTAPGQGHQVILCSPEYIEYTFQLDKNQEKSHTVIDKKFIVWRLTLYA